MSRTRLRPLFGSVVLLLVATGGAFPAAAQDPVTLRFETWRTEDQKLWEEQIIPVFEASHPNIKISYEPTVGTEYDAALTTRFSGGVAGDVIACRAFDGSLKLFNEGYLTPVDAIPGVMENFSDSALTAWRTDDQSTTFCVPMGGSIHGFIYNQAIFDELKLTPPTTQEEFIAVLEAIKAEGSYTPLAMGAADTWTVGTMGYESIGPNYWKGEEGRNGLIDGTAKFTDPEFVGPFGALAAWNPYLPDGYEAVTYSDAQQLFTLGRAVIYPSGSWEIAGFNDQVDFPMGFFKAPLVTADQTPCYTNFHTDIGMGGNAATAHPEEVKVFLEWVATQEFANAYGNAVVGQVPLTSQPVEIADPLLKEFVAATTGCENTIRFEYQKLSRGEPNTSTEVWRVATEVISGRMTPEEAAAILQTGLDSWYTPGA